MENLMLQLPVWNEGILFCAQNISFLLAAGALILCIVLALKGTKALMIAADGAIVLGCGWIGLQTCVTLPVHPLVQFALFALLITVVPSLLFLAVNPLLKSLIKKAGNALAGQMICTAAGTAAFAAVFVRLVYRSILLTAILAVLLLSAGLYFGVKRARADRRFKTYDDLFVVPEGDLEPVPALSPARTLAPEIRTGKRRKYA